MRQHLLFTSFVLLSYAANSQQLSNAGFEEWDTSGKKLNPLHWSVNIDAALHHNPAGVAKKGKKSIIVSTWYSYVPGHLFYGNFKNPDDENNWMNYTVPFTGKPVRLTGYYRYTHTINETDVAVGEILIKDESGDSLAFGRVLLDTISEWKKFEIPLTYHSANKAAAIAVHFISADKRGGMNGDSHTNRLYLDALKLVYE